MELEDILKGLAIFGAIAFSVINKMNKNKENGKGSVAPPPPPIKPKFDPYRAINESAEDDDVDTSINEQKRGQFERYINEDILAQESREDNAENHIEGYTPIKSSITTDEEEKEVITEEPSKKDGINFNLRDAVIMSSILTPKFKEEESL